MARRTAALLAYLGGALLLYSGVSGNVALWETVGAFVAPLLGDPAQRGLLEVVLHVLMVLASLGGAAVVLGGYLFTRDRVVAGKLLVFLGAATGLVGLVIGILLTMAQGGAFADYFATRLNGTAGAFGVLAAWAARRIA